VPGYANPQNLNRFSYVLNNPLRYTDPTGHWVDDGCSLGCSSTSLNNYCATHPEACGNDTNNNKSHNSNNTGNTNTNNQGNDHFCANHPRSCGLPAETSFTSPLVSIGPYSTSMNMCMVPQQGYSMIQILGGLRSFCGNIDPFLPSPFAGTNLSYSQAVSQAAEALQVYAGGNPYSPILQIVAGGAPGACAAYDGCYDLITNTGEYSNLKPHITITPQGATTTILSGVIIAPAIPQILEFLAPLLIF